MQGQRGTISSMTESMNFEYGSTSGGVASDQQFLWSNFQTPSQDQMRGFVLPVNDTTIRCVNSFGQEPRDLGRFGFSEPIANGTHNENIDINQGTHHGRSDMLPFMGAATVFEGREPDRNSLFARSTDSDAMCQNLNLNVDLVDHGDDNFQTTEPSNQYKFSGAERQLLPPGHRFILPSGSGVGYSTEENAGQSSSSGGRRSSCKRKALEGNSGQSSVDVSSSFLTHADSNPWTDFIAQHNEERTLSIPVSSEQVNPRLRLPARMPDGIPDGVAATWTDFSAQHNEERTLGIPASSEQVNPRLRLPARIPDSIPDGVAASVENSRRNFRFRTNPSGQQELLSRGSTRSHYASALSHLSPYLEIDNPSIMMGSPEINHTQSTNAGIRLPSLPQNAQSFCWNGASGSRSAASASPIVPRSREAMSLQERRLRSMSRNLVNHPAFVSDVDFRNSGLNISNRSSNHTSNVHGSLASTSRPRSSAAANPSSLPRASSSIPDSHYPQRFSELVRRSLIPSLGADSGAQSSSNHTPTPPGANTASTELLNPPGVGNWGHHRSYPRSAAWLQRHADGMVEVPHPLQTLASGREGRSRLMASEIRNVLDLMRRGEVLRIEDVMLLDQSVFFGMADVHDRHRDMRLDVDNMSYEELLALEERIGNVCTGLDEASISKCLKRRKWSVALGGQSDVEPCCICQEEYSDGHDVGTLACGHDFHAECIKQWLMHKNLCPICKKTGLMK